MVEEVLPVLLVLLVRQDVLAFAVDVIPPPVLVLVVPHGRDQGSGIAGEVRVFFEYRVRLGSVGRISFFGCRFCWRSTIVGLERRNVFRGGGGGGGAGGDGDGACSPMTASAAVRAQPGSAMIQFYKR